MKSLFVTILLLSFFSVSHAGPFGIKMGTPISELDVKKEHSESVYELNRAPKPHPAFKLYIVFAAPKAGVFKVQTYGKKIKTSPYGTELKAEFEKFRGKLENIYGKHLKVDYLRKGSIWKNSRDYMAGIHHKERMLAAMWNSDYESKLPEDLETIAISTEADSEYKGYIVVEYHFNNAKKAKEEIDAKVDSAL